jgi:hypothetical protein
VRTPSRAQLEIGLLVGGLVVLLVMYRQFLDQSLAIQEQVAEDVREQVAELLAEQLASRNGHAEQVPVDRLPVDGDGATHAPRFAPRPVESPPEQPGGEAA